MIPTHILIHFWQLFVSSLLIFTAAACVMEVCIHLFKIGNPRVRAFLRFLPLLKLPFDFILYRFVFSDYLITFNFFNCNGYLQRKIFHYFPNQSHSTSFYRLIESQVPYFWMGAIILSVLAISLGAVLFKLYQILDSYHFVSKLHQSAQACRRPITNPKLKEALKRANAHILISNKIQIPFAAKGNTIVLPQNLSEDLSQQEFESVIAHELEHLRWFDPAAKAICALFCAFFWWIPTRWWIKKLEEEQECASDAVVYNYGIENTALANAVYKTASCIKSCEREPVALCYLTRSNSLKRVQGILENNYANVKNNYLSYSGMGLALSVFVFIRCWLC